MVRTLWIPLLLIVAGMSPVVSTSYIRPTCRGDFCLHYTPMTWQAAEDVCKNNNGHLAAVRNTSINTQIVLLMLGAVISQVWIGAELQLGNWTWVNGESYNGVQHSRSGTHVKWYICGAGITKRTKSLKYRYKDCREPLYYICDIGNTTICQHGHNSWPQGYIWISPKCYYLHRPTSYLKSWYEARNDCIKKGGDLAVLDTDRKRTSLEQYLPYYLTAWIGLSKVRLSWTSGIKSAYTKWMRTFGAVSINEPNLSKGECTLLNRADSSWRAGDCSDTHPFICQRGQIPITTTTSLPTPSPTTTTTTMKTTTRQPTQVPTMPTKENRPHYTSNPFTSVTYTSNRRGQPVPENTSPITGDRVTTVSPPSEGVTKTKGSMEMVSGEDSSAAAVGGGIGGALVVIMIVVVIVIVIIIRRRKKTALATTPAVAYDGPQSSVNIYEETMPSETVVDNIPVVVAPIPNERRRPVRIAHDDNIYQNLGNARLFPGNENAQVPSPNRNSLESVSQNGDDDDSESDFEDIGHLRQPNDEDQVYSYASHNTQQLRRIKPTEDLRDTSEKDDDDQVELQYNSLYDFGKDRTNDNVEIPHRSESIGDGDEEVVLQYNSLYDFGKDRANENAEIPQKPENIGDGDDEVVLQYNSLYDFSKNKHPKT